MKKLTFAFLFLFCAVSAYANHSFGETITWEKIGSQYKFTLVVYFDCGLAAGNVPSKDTITTNAPIGGFAVHLVQSTNLKDYCYMDSLYSCGTAFAGEGALKKTIYQSSLVTLVGAPSVNGWYFQHEQCCRSGLLSNLSPFGSSFQGSESRMYTAGLNASSAQSVNEKTWSFPIADTNSFFVGLEGALEDSTHYSLTWARAGNNSIVSYGFNYSGLSPLPSGGQNMALTIDPASGFCTFASNLQGFFVVAYTIKAYNNGLIKYSVHKEMTVIIRPNSSNTTQPSAVVSSSSNSALTQIGTNHYKMFVHPNDTSKVEFVITDPDMVDNTVNTSLKLTLYKGDTTCATNVCSKLIAPNGFQTQATQNLTLKSYLSSGLTGKQSYILHWQDNSCAMPRFVAILLDLEFGIPKTIFTDTALYNICEGDSVLLKITGDTSNLQWSPNYNISSTTSASPVLKPDTSTVYTVTNLNDLYAIQIVVNVISSTFKPTTQANGDYVIESNQVAYDSLHWVLNGIVIQKNTDSVLAIEAGNYSFVGYLNNCIFYSDTLAKTSSNLVQLWGNTGPIVDGMGAGSYSFDLSLNQTSNLLDSVLFVIPETGYGKTNYIYNLTITDVNGSVYSDSAKWEKGAFINFEINTALSSNSNYTFTLETNRPQIPLFASNAFPFTENNGIISVNAGAQFTDSQGNSTPIAGFPLAIFALNSGVAMAENKLNVTVYPNPAQDFLIIASAEAVKVEITNLNGQVVISKEVNAGQSKFDLTALAQGIYLVQIGNENGVITEKISIQ